MSVPSETIHATAVAIGDRGVVIRGRSGSGKSSLALSLLTRLPDAMLVADDRVALSVDGPRLLAASPEPLAGLLEVRGLGIVRRRYVSPAAIALVVDLKPLAECPRMPEPQDLEVVLVGIVLPRLFIAIDASDAPSRILAALSLFHAKSLI